MLVTAKVDKSSIEFMQGAAPHGLEINGLSDFVDYVTHNLYQTELQSEILDYLPKTGEDEHPLKESRINLARLRTAWQEAAAHMEKRKKRRVEGAQDDLDEPIEDGIRTDLLTAFHAKHQVSPTMFLMPSDHLLGRVHRELRATTCRFYLSRKLSACIWLVSQRNHTRLHWEVVCQSRLAMPSLHQCGRLLTTTLV